MCASPELMRNFDLGDGRGGKSKAERAQKTSEQQDALTAMLDSHDQKATSEQLKILGMEKKERESAYDNLRALDHSLMLAGADLVKHLPGAQETFADRVTAPLRATEERVWVPVADDFFPYPAPEELAGSARVAVIVDRANDERRHELQEFAGERPMLGLTGDEGSKFFAATWFLLSKLQARAGWTRDPGHRNWRDWQLAAEAMGWRPMLLEMLIILNLPFGPWLSDQWFKQIREAAQYYFDQGLGSNEVLFGALYEHIAADLDLLGDASFGSDAHKLTVFNKMGCDGTFTKKGKRVAMRTFFGWVEGMADLLKSWHIKQFILVYIGCSLGHYKQNGRVPLPGGQAKIKLDTSTRVDGPAAHGNNEDKKAESLRAQCKNTIHVCAELLGCSTRLRRCKILVYMSDPARISHRAEEKLMKGPAAVLRYYVRLAKGEYSFTFYKTAMRLEDASLLKKIGVCLQDYKVKTSSKQPVADARVAATIADEQVMLSGISEFTLNLVKFKALSTSHHSHSYPGMFALLVSADESDRRLGLAAASKAWAAIEAAESKAKNLSQVSKLLSDVPFASWVWPRETFLALAQFGFKYIPEPVADTIRTLYLGFGHSLINENCVNRVKDQYRDAKGTKMAREKRLYTPVAKKLISELYERKEVGFREASAGGAVSEGRPRWLPKGAFESQGCAPSVDDSKLKSIMGGSPSWPSFSPQSSHNIVSAFQLLLSMHESGRWGDAALAWKAVFVQERVVLKKRGSDDLLLVLHSDAFGVLGAVVNSQDVGGKTCRITFGKRFALKFMAITDFGDFKVWLREPVGPNQRHYELGLGYESDALHMKWSDESTTILEVVARRAFKGITDVWMKKLIAFLDLRGEDYGVTGDNAPAHAEILIRGILKGLPDEEIAQIMALRVSPKRTASKACDLDGEVRDQVLESTDKKDFKSEKEKDDGGKVGGTEMNYLKGQKYWKHVEEHLAWMRSEPAIRKAKQIIASASSSARAQGSGKRVGNEIRVETLVLKEARALLPKYKGCLIQDYPAKKAFQVYYSEWPGVPKSKYFTFSTVWTEQQCLLACFRWAWGRHCEHTGAECPHSLPDGPCPPF